MTDDVRPDDAETLRRLEADLAVRMAASEAKTAREMARRYGATSPGALLAALRAERAARVVVEKQVQALIGLMGGVVEALKLPPDDLCDADWWKRGEAAPGDEE